VCVGGGMESDFVMLRMARASVGDVCDPVINRGNDLGAGIPARRDAFLPPCLVASLPCCLFALLPPCLAADRFTVPAGTRPRNA